MSPLPKCAVVYQVSFPDGTWYIGYSKNGYKRQLEHYQESRQHNERLKKRLSTYNRSEHKWTVLHYVEPEDGYEVEGQIIELFWHQPGRLNLTKHRRKPKQKGRPCTVDGIQYPSINDMRRQLFPQFDVGTVSREVKTGNTSYGQILFNITIRQDKTMPQSVQLNGCIYDSMEQAAKSLQTTPSTIKRMVNAGVSSTEEYESYKQAKRCKRKHQMSRTSGVWDGISYNSVRDFSVQLGWTEHHVRELLKSGAKSMHEWREHVWQAWLHRAKYKKQ